MKRMVITGATSMIGVALIEEAIKDPQTERIYAVLRENTEKENRIPSDGRIKKLYCNLDKYEKLPKLINEKCDVFYHLAWPRTATYEESYDDILLKCMNLQTILNAVKAASELGCKKFVGAGSQSEYGIINDGKMSPDIICAPVRADGIIHLAGGHLAGILAQKYNMICVWIRIFSVYGKYDRENSMISSTIRKLRKGEHCAFTLSEQKWDYLWAEDAGRAFYLAGKKGGIQENVIYNVAFGQSRQLREYIEIIRDVVAPEAELGFGEIPYPQNPIMNLSADIASLKRDIGWEPLVDFREGIEKIAFMEERHCL